MSENKIEEVIGQKYDVEIKTNDLKESQFKSVMHIQMGLLNELVQEGAFTQLQKLIQKFTQEQLTNVLQQRNYLERVPLHIACLKGNIKVIKLLVEQHKILGVSLDLIDQNRDTPFNLACSHGSYNIEKIYQIYYLSADYPEFAQRLKNFLSQKYKIIKYLIDSGVDIQKSIIDRKMNPLHWAIYYGDFQSGLEIFNSYPEIMFYRNEKDYTPLETIFDNKLVKVADFASKSLILSIIEIFLQKLLGRELVQQVPTQDQDHFDQLIDRFKSLILKQTADINIEFDTDKHIENRKQKIQQFHEKFINKQVKSTKKLFANTILQNLGQKVSKNQKQIDGLTDLIKKGLNRKKTEDNNNKNLLFQRLGKLSTANNKKDPSNQFTKSMKEMKDDVNYDSDQAEEFGTRRDIELMDDEFEEFKQQYADFDQELDQDNDELEQIYAKENLEKTLKGAYGEQYMKSDVSIDKRQIEEEKQGGHMNIFEEDEQYKQKQLDEEEHDDEEDEDEEDDDEFDTNKEKKRKKDRKQRKSRRNKKRKKKSKKKKKNKKDSDDDDDDDEVKKSNESLYIDSDKDEQDEEKLASYDNQYQELTESLPNIEIKHKINKNHFQEENEYEDTQIQPTQSPQIHNFEAEKQGLTVTSVQRDNFIKIYDEKDNITKISSNKNLQFLHKLLVLLVRTELSSKAKHDYSPQNESYNLKLIRILVEQFGVNPFYIAIENFSAFHLACRKGHYQMVDYFVSQKFQYINQSRQFNVDYQIVKRRGKYLNTAIHVAAEKNRKQIVKLLIEQSQDIQYANFQNCFPLEMNQKQFYIKKNKKLIENKDNNLIEPQLMQLNLQDFSVSFQIYQQYDYLITYKLREQNIQSSLIYSQLIRLREKWTWDGKKIKIKYFEDFRQDKKKDYKICYFLLAFPIELIQKMADDQDMKIYNKSKKFVQSFEYAKKEKYEKFQDFHKHFLIERVLYTQLDMFHLIKNNLVVSLIPLHQFRTRYIIQQNWQKEKYEIFFDFYKTRTELKDLRPLNSLASYYGCDYAFHISFTAQFTSFLVILFFVGLAVQIVDWVEGFTKLDFRYNFVYCIVLIIWLFMTNKFWRRRENEYALVWNTISYEKRDNISLDYRGIYTIDTVNQKITKINNIPSKTRRIFSDLLLAIIGGGLIVAQFFIITEMQQDISKMPEQEIRDTWKFSNASFGRIVLSASVGILNSVLIFIWTFIYNFVSQKLVIWENHKYESDNESSYITKSFIFQWVLAYINLFYYAFGLQSVDILATNFITLFFSKNILFLLLNDLIPHVLFIIKKKMFLKKWIVKRRQEKIDKVKQYYPDLIDEKSGEFKKTQEELTTIEKEFLQQVEKNLIQKEQVYINTLMPQPVDIDRLWLFFILQFGYIAYFSISFPIITIACIIMNIIHIFYTFYSFNNFMQRIKSKIARDIGIWNGIVLIMVISAFFINVLIINYTTKASRIEVFKAQTQDEIVNYYQKIYEIEHMIILFFIIVSFGISNYPGWVQTTIDQQKYREQFYIEKQKQAKELMKDQILQELQREQTI